ncbi:MAG: hypothetical protein ACE5GD_00865 [Candidatus Geothermarchaeales archaeon]
MRRKRSSEVKGYNLERYLFAMHRITGLYMIGFLIFHILLTGQRVSLSLWESVAPSVNNEVMLPFVIAVIFHGLNGIRLIINELGYMIGEPKLPVYPYKATSLGLPQKALAIILMILSIVFSLVALMEFLYGW